MQDILSLPSSPYAFNILHRHMGGYSYHSPTSSSLPIFVWRADSDVIQVRSALNGALLFLWKATVLGGAKLAIFQDVIAIQIGSVNYLLAQMRDSSVSPLNLLDPYTGSVMPIYADAHGPMNVSLPFIVNTEKGSESAQIIALACDMSVSYSLILPSRRFVHGFIKLPITANVTAISTLVPSLNSSPFLIVGTSQGQITVFGLDATEDATLHEIGTFDMSNNGPITHTVTWPAAPSYHGDALGLCVIGQGGESDDDMTTKPDVEIFIISKDDTRPFYPRAVGQLEFPPHSTGRVTAIAMSIDDEDKHQVFISLRLTSEHMGQRNEMRGWKVDLNHIQAHEAQVSDITQTDDSAVLSLYPRGRSPECSVLFLNRLATWIDMLRPNVRAVEDEAYDLFFQMYKLPIFEDWFSTFPYPQPLADGIRQRRGLTGMLFIDRLLAMCQVDGSQAYPPQSMNDLQTLYNNIIASQVNPLEKTCFIYYLLLDTTVADGIDAKTESFLSSYGVPEAFRRVIFGYWSLDHGSYQEAISQLTHPSIENDFPSAVLQTLYLANQPKEALRFIKIVNPALTDFQDEKIVLKVLLQCSGLDEAFTYQRKKQDGNDWELFKCLVEQCFSGSSTPERVRLLLTFPLESEEEAILLSYCATHQHPAVRSFALMYYIYHGRYSEAVASYISERGHKSLPAAHGEADRERHFIVENLRMVLGRVAREAVMVWEESLLSELPVSVATSSKDVGVKRMPDTSEASTSNKRLRDSTYKSEVPERTLIRALKEQLNAQPILQPPSPPIIPAVPIVAVASSSDIPAVPSLAASSTVSSSATPTAHTPKVHNAVLEEEQVETESVLDDMKVDLEEAVEEDMMMVDEVVPEKEVEPVEDPVKQAPIAVESPAASSVIPQQPTPIALESPSNSVNLQTRSMLPPSSLSSVSEIVARRLSLQSVGGVQSPFMKPPSTPRSQSTSQSVETKESPEKRVQTRKQPTPTSLFGGKSILSMLHPASKPVIDQPVIAHPILDSIDESMEASTSFEKDVVKDDYDIEVQSLLKNRSPFSAEARQSRERSVASVMAANIITSSIGARRTTVSPPKSIVAPLPPPMSLAEFEKEVVEQHSTPATATPSGITRRGGHDHDSDSSPELSDVDEYDNSSSNEDEEDDSDTPGRAGGDAVSYPKATFEPSALEDEPPYTAVEEQQVKPSPKPKKKTAAVRFASHSDALPDTPDVDGNRVGRILRKTPARTAANNNLLKGVSNLPNRNLIGKLSEAASLQGTPAAAAAARRAAKPVVAAAKPAVVAAKKVAGVMAPTASSAAKMVAKPKGGGAVKRAASSGLERAVRK
ncbi:hypothetical protein SmJEL517_g04550 [Synchytrium microbalum]|uniref:ELYS-like domain-containing protein n=1 Tax=Synchytrium microbalum TaxID=1806994 RepID=A0A507BY68_9FUNG|nr:uncharacterized protein SmJEL517_g04550 [Synchytrium microbalum]TPX32372.1 hypothetical protein SmJEL517_g04550 [Synchytrium microbalum]